jgi:16S rRNA (guanine(1405)-N(7))-methyltransferase
LLGFFEIIHVQGTAQACNVIRSCPTRKFDLAFLLKALPCLEQVDKAAGLRLLEEIHANYMLVSFPAQSLGGRKREMGANYEARFREMVEGKGWSIERFGFINEVVFRIVK